MKARWLAGAAAALVLLLACERLSTVKRCRALAKEVNHALDDIEAQSEPRTPAAYAGASRGYAALARSLPNDERDAGTDAGADAAVVAPPPDAGELERAVSDYRATLEAASRATAELAEALDAGNQASAAVMRRDLEALSQKAKLNVKRIDATCRPD